jgi:hypothetical protein
MAFKIRCALIGVVLTLIGGSLWAEDIGLVSVNNEYQAEVLRQTVGHALTRVEDRFLVALDAAQIETLTRAGLETDILATDYSLSSSYLIRPNRKDRQIKVTDKAAIPGAVDIGTGMVIATMSDNAARSLTDVNHLLVSSLDELNVRITYMPRAVSTLLTQITDYPTDSLMNLVSQDSLYAYDSRLEAFRTRYIYSDSINAAKDWIVQKFHDWGYTQVTTPGFYYDGSTYLYNVMAVKPGYAEPDAVIVIGGHYDSITYGEVPGPYEYAPGADDNGTGTVTAMELARILKDVPLRKTVIFMAFTAEEVGLVGSAVAASNFASNGTNVEVMLNFDMVAYDPTDLRQLDIASGPNSAYRDLMANTAVRLGTINPVISPMGSSSDHYSFYAQGFNIVDNIEDNFNQDGWHTNLDITSRLNFEFFTDVVKTAAATVGIIANSAHPTEIANIIDEGDGQSLNVIWSNCDPNYTYTIYYGQSSGSYDHTVPVSPGACSYIVNGLSEGVRYYFTVVGQASEGYPALYSVESSAVPYVIPRAPTGLTADPADHEIQLNWSPNMEADFSHYRIYRDDSSGFQMLQDNITGTSYVDDAVVGQIPYRYKITAVDMDQNESEFSTEHEAYAATFDGGVLLVDETASTNPMPPQAQQELYFSRIFGATPYALDTVTNSLDPITRNKSGRYSSIFWFDDDLANKLIEYSEDTLKWYLDYSDNILVEGFRVLPFWTTSPVSSGNIVYQDFGITSFTENTAFDFVGATGQNGWPSVEVDMSNIFGKLPDICKLTARSGAQVIYTYDSFTDDPAYEGRPCGVLYPTAQGNRILLTFPLYFLKESSAKALIAHAVQLFGEGNAYIPGDIDGSGFLDIGDLIYLVNYAFDTGPEPPNMNAADVDGSCDVDISDVIYLAEYSFGNPPGPNPVEGCVF